jgi:hypothetical protein
LSTKKRISGEVAMGKSSRVTIEYENGSIIATTPYDANFVTALKQQIPYTHRAWNGQKKAWLISSQYADTLQMLIYSYYNVDISIKPPESTTQEPQIQVLILEYVGVCKERQNGLPSPSAMGFHDGSWSVVLPEKVLHAFFDKVSAGNHQTYYDVLCVEQDANQIEIKSAFRRMARQWHPDHCKEHGAEAVFKDINEAYQILFDSVKRKKYNAALKYSQDANSGRNHSGLQDMVDNYYGYRSPLRCGIVVCEGVYRLNRFIVSNILTWSDCTNAAGQTMTSYWSKDAENFVVEWI